MADKHTLHALSVKELRARLKERGAKTSGKKAELVARILEVPLESILEECAACAKRAVVGFVVTEDGQTLCTKCQDNRVREEKERARAERAANYEPAIDPLSDEHPDFRPPELPLAQEIPLEDVEVRVEVRTELGDYELVDEGLVPLGGPRWPSLPKITPDPSKRRTLPDLSDTATVKRIYDAYRRSRDDDRRGFTLPIGQLGDDCERALWYKLRWAAKPELNGQAIRRFERGNREEELVLEELRNIGIQVWSTRADVEGHHVPAFVADGWHVYSAAGELKESVSDQETAIRRARERDELQIKITTLDGHVGGRLDAVAKGFEEAPKTPHVVEVKNPNAKGMDKLEKLGVAGAFPKHYAQAIVYMLLLKLKRAVYFASGKNADRIHFERLRMDKTTRAHAKELLARAERVVRSSSPPDRIRNDPTFWKCKFCDFRKICHETKAPEKSCRTCVHSTPVLDGSGRERPLWICEFNGGAHELPADRQKLGCPMHLYIPGVLEPVLEYVGAENAPAPRFVEYRDEQGRSVFNAIEDGFLDELTLELATDAVFTSSELEENPIDTSTNYAELRAKCDEVPF